MPPRPLLLLSCLVLSAPAWAQLDLPKKRPQKGAGPSPGTGSLELPARPEGETDPALEELRPDLELPVGDPALAAPGTLEPVFAATPTGAADYIFDALEVIDDPDHSLARSAVASLGAIGPPGREACRRALWKKSAVQMVTAARVLLTYGDADDRRAVSARLREDMPTKAAAPMLQGLVDADPVLADPAFLIGQLDHPVHAMRVSSQRLLVPRVGPAELPLLSTKLGAERTHTRLLTVGLIGRVRDPSVLHLLASRLGDSSSKVAYESAQLIAGLDGEDAVPYLLERVFGGQRIDRAGAYGLLSLIEREDARRVVVLRDEHVPELLAGLQSGEAIVAGVSAAALAGIGFRSADARATDWLDREVPHTLVRLASGAEFHKDFSALQRPALARLALITGQTLGRNGPAWQQWWSENALGFKARRAVLSVGLEDVGFLVVSYQIDVWSADTLVLVGPALGRRPETEIGVREEVVYLTSNEAEELVLSLDAAGVLGGERLPGRFGTEIGRARGLEVEVRGKSKRFELAKEEAEIPELSWFEQCAKAVEALAAANRWQHFHGPETSQYEFWIAERDWWGSETSVVVRSRRFKELLLLRLAASQPTDREADLVELERVYREVGVPEPADFGRFLDLIRDETFFSGRGRRVFALALVAAATTGEPPRPAGATVEPELGRDLFDLLTAEFGEEARPESERVLAASGREVVREIAADEDPYRRSLVPAALSESSEGRDLELLLGLLEDPSDLVEAAAVRALGAKQVEAARDQLLLRARTSVPLVRAEALRAMGRLGGQGVLNVCILALAEKDARVQQAAAFAMGDLADPESAAILASLFAQGPGSDFFDPARRGLARLGESAWPELMRLTTASSEAVRREAALLLAEQGSPFAASTLMAILTEHPDDTRVAAELAVLTCVDYRDEESPVQEWWRWWDLVVHDDSLAWLLGAVERAGISAPPVETLTGDGTREGAGFLADLMRFGPPHIAERGRRELERQLGEEVDAPPETDPERRAWFDELELTIADRYGE